LRYQLLPYLYLLFVEAHRSGTPIMRPLLWHDQQDPLAVAVDDQFLLGANLLVAPILRQGARGRSVYLPRGEWFDFWSGERHIGRQHVLAKAGLHLIPLYVRAGSVIPMIAVQQYIGQTGPSTINLHVWAGERGDLQWYEDDGSSLAYSLGEIHERRIVFHRARRGYQLHLSEARGPFQSEVKVWRVILRGSQSAGHVRVNGRPVRAKFDSRLGLLAFEIPNTTSNIEVRIHV